MAPLQSLPPQPYEKNACLENGILLGNLYGSE